MGLKGMWQQDLPAKIILLTLGEARSILKHKYN
jgi:hypothetical protein